MPKSAYAFDFEQPIRELEDRYNHLCHMAAEDDLDLQREIESAREKIDAGALYGDVVQDPRLIGKLTIGAVHEHLTGGAPQAVIPVDVGTYQREGG